MSSVGHLPSQVINVEPILFPFEHSAFYSITESPFGSVYFGLPTSLQKSKRGQEFGQYISLNMSVRAYISLKKPISIVSL